MYVKNKHKCDVIDLRQYPVEGILEMSGIVLKKYFNELYTIIGSNVNVFINSMAVTFYLLIKKQIM